MKSQNGIVLISALIVLIVVSVLSVSYLFLVRTNLLITAKNINFTNAFYITEAGFSDAVRYEEDNSFSKEFGGGSYECEVSVAEDGSKVITSVGNFRNARRTIRARVIKEEDMYKITNWLEA